MKVILVVCLYLSFFQQVNAQETERWYKVSIADNPVGYVLEKSETDGAKTTSLLEMNVSIGRLGSSVNMHTQTTQIEENEQLLGINSEMDISNQKKIETVEVKKDQLVIQSQGMTRNLPLEDELTSPKKLEKLIKYQIDNNQEDISYSTYSAELGMFMNANISFIGFETLNLNGTTKKVILAEERVKELPYVKKKWFNRQGILLKSVEPSPFGKMVVERTTKEEALNYLTNSVDLPEEQYGSTMAYSNHRLAQPRKVTAMKIKINQNRPEFGFPDFSGDYQKIISQTDDEVILQIQKPEPSFNKSKSNNLDEYLKPNAYLDHSDELIIQKTQEVVGNVTDDWEKAQLIIEWVRTNMSFDAGIAFADSRECIRELKGTCVSYSVLTATMCRAAGIPSRFLMGYVYVDGAWGGHAWVEAYINSKWIPIDAAVPNNSGIADAARFYMVRSSLQSGTGGANVAGMQLYGNVDVEILEYKMNDKWHTSSKSPYQLVNDTYYNPGLSFRMKRLKGFEFIDLDKFYPEKTILKQTNSSSEVIIDYWNFGIEEDVNQKAQDIFAIVKAQQKPENINFEQYKGQKIKGENKSVAILQVDSQAFFSIVSKGENHFENLEQSLKAIK